MKKVLSILLVTAMLMSFLPIMSFAVDEGLTADTVFASGKTYYINNYEDFKTFIDLINAGQTGQGSKFELTSDIIINHGKFSLDVNNDPLYVGQPITKSTKLIECEAASDFRGTLDGKNHSIMGYYSTTSGIFDLLYGATVKDLCIKNSLFDLRGSSAESAGALCAKADNYPQIRNVIFNGIIINDGAVTGGIVGESIKALLYDCRNRGTVIGDDYCGGLVGKVTNDCSLLDCANNGTVLSTGDFVGGIVANITPKVAVKRCANPGTVKSTGNYVGGIAGDINMDNNMVEDCYHTGTVSGNDYVGGLGGNFYSAGDNLEEYWAEYHAVKTERKEYGDMLAGDGIYIQPWPPVWADDYYMELYDKEIALYDEIRANSPEVNFKSVYSAGSVTANGNYVGGLFGGFDGCLLRFGTLHYNYSISGLRPTGYNKLETETNRICYGEVDPTLAWTDEQLKSEHFARQIGSTTGLDVYLVDDTNENNGYVILRGLVSDETEPGYTDITQTVTALSIGTTDTITFASDETKKYSFTPETDGDYKIEVSTVEKAAVVLRVYKNGEFIDEDELLMTNLPATAPTHVEELEHYEITMENLLTTDEVLFEISDCTNSFTDQASTAGSFIKNWCTPSSINISVENVTPVVEEQPLFNFGVTQKHIQKKYDMIYYPATFDFSMYDDANIRYLGICQEVANVEFGSKTKVIAKYIYDAATLKFIEVYTNGFDSTAQVLEQGSTGETGPDGQEYNYIVVQADFSTINYSNESAPYYLKFSVLEDNFINEDGTVRTVVDNAPYEDAPGEQLFVWEVTDADGVAQNIGDRIRFNSASLEEGPYTYEDLLLKDNLNEVNMYISNDISAAHARVDNFAYYPCKFMTRRSYADLIRSLTGFEDGSTQVQFIMSYDSSTLELIDALPSKELYDIGGTATIIETGDLNYEEDPDRRYAIVQIDFEGFADIENGYLFTLKFNVLKENFIDENGRPIDLVNFESFTDDATYVASCFWKVTDNQGKSYDINWYVLNGHMDVDSLESYSDLIIEGYEPFDPTLISDVTEVTYIQQEDTRKTFTVKINGRKSMIQFIEPDGGTRTYDRYNKNVKITSYNADGEVVSAMSRDLAYEVWEIRSNMSVGVEIKVRGKENGKWDAIKYSFTIEPYSPVISMELSSASGKKGAVPATVVADEKTEKVMFKMPNDTSVTVSTYTTDENGNRVFTGKAWMNEDGLNEIRVYIRRDNVWRLAGTLEYTVE